jgi:hypothetical protein
MKTTSKRRIGAAIAAVGTTMFSAAAAHAADLRSWDQRIDDATKRFVVLPVFGNQAVLDKETQLVWQRQPNAAQTWYVAMDTCLLARTGGRAGWRLPAISELSSLVGTTGTLAAGHPFSGIPANGHFWSSTGSSSTLTAYLRSLTVDHGTVAGKTYQHPSLCVRGTGAPDRY